MIERAIAPLNRVVTLLAGRREVRPNVIHRRLRVVVVVLVAAHARRVRNVVVAIDVAIRTLPGRNRMRARQRPPGGRVVKRSVCPLDCVVTLLAGRREVRANVVHRRLRIVVVVLVTADARRVRDVVVTVHVAVGTLPWRNGMRTCQGKTRSGMVESAIAPLDGIVTLFTIGGEMRSHVIHRRLCVVVVVLVTAHARRIGDVVVVVDVAVRTLPGRNRVRSRQRES